MATIEIQNLGVSIRGTQILRDVSFSVEAGQTLGIVGESGCGKTMLGLTLMGMLPPGGQISSGSILFEGIDLATNRERDWLALRGSQIGMVMQDPFTALNPVMRVGDQVAESLILHQNHSKAEAWSQSIELLSKVGIPSPDQAARKFPHQMSGGQRQRVVIAIAYACKPKVLIADEPTTALDVTLQAQILNLLNRLQAEEGTAIIIISHNVGVIAAVADHIAVFYAGQAVELGETTQILGNPQHPYSQGLLAALPSVRSERLLTIKGQPPDFAKLTSECAYRPRCPYAFDKCAEAPPLQLLADGQASRCWRAGELTSATSHSGADQKS